MPITRSKQQISDFQKHVNERAVAIREAAQASWDNIDFSVSEPKIVYQYLKRAGTGTDHLNGVLTPIIGVGGRVAKFASIFLHQKPMVYGCATRAWASTMSAKKCELGDLQIIFLYLAQDKTVCQCRSTIFQAKKAVHDGDYVIDHRDQRQLYDNCYGFEYASVLPGERRELPTGLQRERALQYLFVGKQPVRSRTIPARASEGAFIDFGEMIVRLLNDSSGLEVTANPDNGTGWDQIVWDVIRHVADTATSRGMIRNEGLRGLLDHFNSFEDKTNYFLEVPPDPETPQESSGFGIMLAIMSDEELREWPSRAPINDGPRVTRQDPPTQLEDRILQKARSLRPHNLVTLLELAGKTERNDVRIEVVRALVKYTSDWKPGPQDRSRIEQLLKWYKQRVNPTLVEEIRTLEQLLVRQGRQTNRRNLEQGGSDRLAYQ